MLQDKCKKKKLLQSFGEEKNNDGIKFRECLSAQSHLSSCLLSENVKP
jgi:hypothetical protein